MAEIRIIETKNKRAPLSDGEIIYSDGRTEKLEYGITEIAEKAYMDKSDIIRVVLPESLEKINDSAFFHCLNLESVTLPEGISEICFSAFSHCAALKDPLLPNSLQKISSFSFSCTSITELAIPDGIEEIECYAFFHCTELKKVYIPASITTFDTSAFKDCNVKDVYYGGSAEDWARINPKNAYFPNSTDAFVYDNIHYNSSREDYEAGITKKEEAEAPKAQPSIFQTIKNFLKNK